MKTIKDLERLLASMKPGEYWVTVEIKLLTDIVAQWPEQQPKLPKTNDAAIQETPTES